MTQILNAFPIMVFKKQLSDGTRKIMSIVEGIDYNNGKVKYTILYRFQKSKEFIDKYGKVHIEGEHRKVGNISDKLALKLYENDVPEKIIKKYARSDWTVAKAYSNDGSDS